MPKIRCLLSWVVLVAGLANPACSIDKLPGVYRIDVQQGNVVTTEMLEQVELGMERRKVRFVLGTPLVTDAFHQDRWDYVFIYQPGSGDRVQQRVSLFFEGGRLARIDSDLKPDMDFHTVVVPHDGVILVSGKKNDGFFAALVPGFMKRDKSKQTKSDAGGETVDEASSPAVTVEAETRSDSTDEVVSTAAVEPATTPPALGDTSAVVGVAVMAPAAAADSTDDEILPDEVYAPNAITVGKGRGAADLLSAGYTTGTTSPPGNETQPADTAPIKQNESEFLEQLFDDFGESYQGAVKRNRKEQTEAQSSTTPRD